MSFAKFKHLSGTAGYSPVAADVDGVLRKRTPAQARADIGALGGESAVNSYVTYSVPASGGWISTSPSFTIPANYFTPGRCLRLTFVGAHGSSTSALEDVLIDGAAGTTYMNTPTGLHKTVIEILCASSGSSGSLFVSYSGFEGSGAEYRSENDRACNTTVSHEISLGTNTNSNARTAICYLATMETIA